MTITLTVREELPQGKILNELSFEVQAERLTVRDLIRQRVHQEISLLNIGKQSSRQRLVQPREAELRLNDRHQRQQHQVDWEKQAQLAIQSFEENAYFILVDDRQVESLDEYIDLHAETQITFLRLVPLVGG